MKTESQLIIEIWDLVRDQIQPARRLETAVGIIRACEEAGMDERDLEDILDEDAYLTRAYRDVFATDEEGDDDNYNEDE